MAIGKDGVALRRLRALFDLGAIRELSDGQLLERFATGRGESAELAFAALVERHGPMVLRVCRSVLADPHDAQDAFQATFLVLVRKARSLWVRDSIGPWLHRVAHRAASGARSAAARRRRLEQRAAEAPARSDREVGDDLIRVIHEEIGRLPERFRSPVVLCDLEGRTHEQAARHLGWPIGTVKSRLSRARDRLRDRLSRRGVVPNPGRLVVPPSVPPALVDATAGAAVRFLATRAIAPGSAAMLAQGVLRSMIYLRWLKLGSALLVLGATTSGVALLAQDGPSNVTRPVVARAVDATTVKVGPGKLRITVSGRGALQPTTVAAVHSEIEGQTTLIRILPERSPVKRGDVVGELDSAALRDRLVNRRIAVQQAEASYKQAVLTREVAEFAVKEHEEVDRQEREALAAEVDRTEAAIVRGGARLDRARLARKKLDELKARREPASFESVVSDLLVDDKLDDAELTLERERAALKLAKARMAPVLRATQGRTARQLNAEVERARSDELPRLSTWELEKDKVAKLERQIKACVLLAPDDGEVDYSNNATRPGQPSIEPGATVRERQKIFEVVDPRGPLRVAVKVREAMVDQVNPGLRARIKVNSIAGESITGTVEAVAPMPDVQQHFETGQKLYTTLVAIENRPPGLRPGMSTEVEILIRELDDVLVVPVGSLVCSGETYHVAVKPAEGVIYWREVALGASDGEVVEVRRGLKAGEAVVLSPGPLMNEELRRKFGSPVPPTPPAAAPR